MRSEDQNGDGDRRPAFECRFDPDTGDLDEKCVRAYLLTQMPLAV